MLQARHERSLAQELEGRPFTIIGVNADKSSPDQVLKRSQQSGITWRSFTNDSQGLDGPITREWNIRTLPTTYLVDHEGTIVARWTAKLATPEQLREAVMPAVERAESAAAGQ